jgi:class 3 adenylate cyclase/predicted ATPase
MTVADWLRSLGLEQYEPAFRENEIDWAVLSELTEADLEKLGLPLGPRKKLLKAIAGRFAGSGPTSVTEAAPPAIMPAAERRQLTVMFCDLVGSTALSERLDAEELGDLVRGYAERVRAQVEQFEGHIAKYMGDGVLAYFGWPQAHEDDAERAIRAGLAIVEAVRGLRPFPDITPQVRIGIATGLVVVGELIGSGEAKERSVVGETPNLAARLQALAEPNAIVIGRRTRALIGNLFELADLGTHDVKGFGRPVRAWRVLGEGRAEGRFEALRAASLTPLVGREEELAFLLRRWERALDGEGQVVLLSGEPGIGKSRLTRALRQELAEESYTGVLHFCSPYHESSALYPLTEHLQRAAQFERGDGDERKLAKLERLLDQSTEDLRGAVPLLAGLLSIPTGVRYPALDLAPEQQKARTLEALVAQVEGLARRRPVLALWEDVHWIDPTSLELLDLLVERVRTLAVLVVITFRPEFKPPWTDQPHVTSLILKRLSRKHGAAIVERLTGGKALPAEVKKQIVAKTDGVPLFVEELTKTVLESGLLREEHDRYALQGPLPPLAIPATLYDSLTARLDRLVPVKEVAQIGAAIGRVFSYELLAFVSSLRENELRDALTRLEDAELVFRHGTPPHANFRFKHALVQDAAYDSLLRSKRQHIHATLATVLQERFPETATTQPEVLAHHYTAAGLAEPAVRYWLKAGQRAAELSANLEAVGHLTKGLDVLKAMLDFPDRAELEFELQSALCMPLIATKGYAAPETGDALARAHWLGVQLKRTDQLFPILYGQWAYHVVGGENPTGCQRAREFLSLAEGQVDPDLELVGHRMLGMSLLHLGNLCAAQAQFEEALALYDPKRHRALAFRYGQDQGASALSFLSLNLWLAGFPDRASREVNRALKIAEDLNHANSRGYALVLGAATQAQLRHNAPAVQGYADAVISLSEEHGLNLWLAWGKIFRGWALAEQGQQREGIAELAKALADCQTMRARFHRPYHLSLLAETLHHCGQTEDGLRVTAEALTMVEQIEERWWEADLHRLKGDLLLSLGGQNVAEAEACYNQAMADAGRQGAKSLGLRAATGLARLWQKQGMRAEAHNLLAPIYGKFSEGFATPDMEEARALLGKLQ